MSLLPAPTLANPDPSEPPIALTGDPEVGTALRGVKELLLPPERWARGAAARAGEEWLDDARDQRATSWCLSGAVLKVASDRVVVQVEGYLLYVIQHDYRGHCVPCFNDERMTDHKRIHRVVDKAIALADELKAA